MFQMKRAGKIIPACIFLLLLVTGFVPVALYAQVDTGGVTGTVTDPTGAAVPGAQITLTNPSTGISLTAQSTATGSYTVSGVRTGTYVLKAEAPGFRTFTVIGVEVHIQNILTIDVKFEAGQVTQQVEVTASAPLLQAENGSVGQTIRTQTVNDLPLQGRNWTSLSQLSAGVTTAPPGQPSSDSGASSSAFFVVDGANLWQNDFRLNGINDNIEMYGGSSVNSNATITPPPDAIEEFKLQNGNFSAEFGHSTGGVVNATTKSGTNRFHGDVWEYVRNDVFNANLFFNKLNQKARPEYRQNIFGATIGGPIVRDKTFFFFAYQGQRYVLPSPATSTVPTAAMVNSGFTNLQDLITYNSGTGTDALGRVIPHGTVLDPATTRQIPASGVDPITGLSGTAGSYVRDPFYTGSLAGKTTFVGATSQLNIIPASRIDPNAVKLLGVYPTATASGLNNNFFWSPRTVTNVDTYDLRIDEHINDKNILNGTYDRSLYSSAVPSALPNRAVGQSGGRNDSFPAYAFAVGYTHVFTTTLTNEMHVGMMHADKLQRSVFGNTMGIPAEYGIQGIPQVANNGGIPPININGLTHIGVGNFTPTLQYVYSIEGADSVTKVYRNHAFKMGVQVDDIEGDISQPPQGRGFMTYSGQYSDIPNKNSNLTGLGDMLLVPIASTVGGVKNVGGLGTFSGSNISATDDHRWYIGAYFQDDWKITPDLTLNLGLRWDYFTPYAESSGRQANFVANGGNGNTGTYYISNKGCAVSRSASFDALLVSSNITLKCVSGLTLGNAQKTNFAPRLGFAYRVNPTLAVRGGYGIAYGALGNLGYGGTLGTNYPFVYTSTFPSPDSQHPIVLPNGATATMESAFAQINISDPTVNSGQGLNLYGRQYDFKTPYIQSFNLTVQDQFTNHDSIQIAYVGSTGRHLDNLGYFNSPSQLLPPSANPQNYVPFPSFARNATYETTNATSSYNSLQVTYERQLGAGLSVLANYTYSKCLTDQHTQASQNQQYRAEWLPGFGIAADYGLCDTDATNVVHGSGSYALPFGHGREWLGNANKLTDLAVGGWNVNFIYTYQTGQPFTVNCPIATSAFGCFANVVPGANIYGGKHNYSQWLNPQAFAQPAAATAIGQSNYAPLGGGPQQARGPHFTNLDASILKDFTVTETVRLQFRAEAFNATNTTPLAQPATGTLNFLTTNFSSITSARGGPNASRRLQLAMKLFF
ncbi:carboxypeptidase-like regulatory domain-containing protein [Edaphobacter bradus]|uniref:carboxypeptidase-like regulatory domain-containing protein n=1 Tax=Edaphobacter bradus TaxID=2259016 RepID=UPI0021E0D4D3|nr:TonB-dependent receptor [Edaphobacter bradus]